MTTRKDTAKKRKGHRRGRRAELLARLWLRMKGYKIVAQRVKTPVGEIDIVARRGQVLSVIEVKRRDDLASALSAVSPRQQRRIVRAAQWFAARKLAATDLSLRFDVIAVVPGRLPAHIMDAWREAEY